MSDRRKPKTPKPQKRGFSARSVDEPSPADIEETPPLKKNKMGKVQAIHALVAGKSPAGKPNSDTEIELRLVAEMAMKAGKEQIGDAAWDALTEPQRDAKCWIKSEEQSAE